MIHHEIEPYKDNDNRCPNKYMCKCINICVNVLIYKCMCKCINICVNV